MGKVRIQQKCHNIFLSPLFPMDTHLYTIFNPKIVRFQKKKKKKILK